MPAKAATTLRDPAKPVEHYRRVAADFERLIEGHVGVKNFLVAPGYSVFVARAHYSAGDPVDVCRRDIERAAAYRLEHFAGRGYRLDGYPAPTTEFEVYGAAELVGRAGELVKAFRRCTVTTTVIPRVSTLWNAFCAIWTGEKVALTAAATQDIHKNKEWLGLPALFQATATGDADAFGEALAAYLSTTWQKSVKALARGDDYAGRWCFLAAGLCQHMGFVPPLDEKTRQYIPTELLTVPARQ